MGSLAGGSKLHEAALAGIQLSLATAGMGEASLGVTRHANHVCAWMRYPMACIMADTDVLSYINIFSSTQLVVFYSCSENIQRTSLFWYVVSPLLCEEKRGEDWVHVDMFASICCLDV